MKVEINETTIDEFLNSFRNVMDAICDEISVKYDYKDKKDDERLRYDAADHGCNDEEELGGDDEVILTADEYDDMLETIEKEEKHIEALKEQNRVLINKNKELVKKGQELMEASDKVAKMNNDVSAAKNNMDKIISDKLYADGYKIFNDVKVYVEFARKCDALQNPGFKDILGRIKKAAGDFLDAIEIKKEW